MAGEFGIHPLYKMLGYFSLIGLLRLHSLLGDYFQAIKVLENVELNKKVSLKDCTCILLEPNIDHMDSLQLQSNCSLESLEFIIVQYKIYTYKLIK